jgi:uncharacterized protein YndB with AHSA1/START domain
MLNIVGIVAAVLVLVILGVLALATTKPATFRVERAATIAAPPERVFALLNDFHAWEQWSPWARLDPAMTTTYSGPASGPGAVYEWLGNKAVGQGRMAILESTPPRAVTIQLDFLKPFEAHNTTVFTLTPAASGTHVQWAMFGPNTFMGKVMGVFISMDQMIGKDFEKGLATMKGVAER